MKTHQPTLPELIDEYLEYCLHVRELSRNSIAAFRSDLQCFLKYTGKTEFQVFNTKMVQGYFLHLKRDRRLTSETVHRRRMTLTGFAKWLIGLRLLKSNPVDHVQLGRRVRRTRQTVYDAEQIRSFLRGATQGYVHPECQRLMQYLLVFTGMRRSEILALRWKHVDLDNQLLSVYDSKWTKAKGHPDGLDRQIPLVSLLEQELKRVREALEPASGSAVILGYRCGPMSKDQFTNAVRAWALMAGCPGATAHCFRHSLSSNLVMRGASEQDVAALLGHGNRTVTQGYIHTTLDRLRQLLESYAADVSVGSTSPPQASTEHRSDVAVPGAGVLLAAAQPDHPGAPNPLESLWATLSAVSAPSFDPRTAFLLGMLAAGTRHEKPG